MPRETLEPLSQAEDRLQRDGFTHDFTLTDDGVVDRQTSVLHAPEQIEIVSMHRDEGESNPSDESMLFALRATDGSRGLLAVNYGANVPHADMIRRLGTGVLGTKYARGRAGIDGVSGR